MTGTLDAVWIYQRCAEFGIPFEPVLSDTVADKMAEHAELIASGIDDYGFRMLIACCIDELEPMLWLESMKPVIDAFETAVFVRGVLAQRSEEK